MMSMDSLLSQSLVALDKLLDFLEKRALPWFNWRIRGGLINGWKDFVEKFKIRFAPLHALDYISFEKTSEKAKDIFVHVREDATTLSAPTAEDIDDSKESSAGSHIKEDDYSGSDIIGEGGGALIEDYGANIQSDEPSNKSSSTPCESYVPPNTSVGMTIVAYKALANIEKVANLISFAATNKLFDIVDVVKTKHLISSRATTYAMRPVASFHHFAARAKMIEDSKSGLLLWFSILSPVLKHEWEPPP
ncbi:unnamed protein product [Cuscuta campestris]|uniref:Retrotransposon gag domain-containing protein n=1 Tax=Cuscuta campestris TaxID=132261 RepID=A0A484NIT3_9ASTE|nr:unnamed protein product [Cuscuta campestris]